MNLCSENHEEICIEGRVCPLCEKIAELEEVKAERDDLKKQLDET